MKKNIRFMYMQMLTVMVTTCAVTLGAFHYIGTVNQTRATNSSFVRSEIVHMNDDILPLAYSLSINQRVENGLAMSNEYGYIDWTNKADAIVTVCYTASTNTRIKCSVTGNNTSYAYDIVPGVPTVLSLTGGDGNYDICLLENLTGTKYQVMTRASIEVSMSDPLAPYLTSNPFVDWTSSPDTINKARELTAGKTTQTEKVAAIYNYVIENMDYDYEKADNVKSGYLPELDEILQDKKGICLDYASLVAGMLRSQDIPCQLVIGYAGSSYHAWISVWSEENGWERMDPTFASSGNSSPIVLSYIGDGSNYNPERYY